MGSPSIAKFQVICPSIGKISDTCFEKDLTVSTVVDCLKELFQLNGDFYLRQNGREFVGIEKIMEIQETICLLLKKDDECMALNRNLELALQHNPELLYKIEKKIFISIRINETTMQGFLDTGAEQSILTPRSVDLCRLNEMVDTRFLTIATGVGGTKLVSGKIMFCRVEVEDMICPTSFLVMDLPELLNPGDALLGLNFIKKYVKYIDLDQGMVVFKSGITLTFQ